LYYQIRIKIKMMMKMKKMKKMKKN